MSNCSAKINLTKAKNNSLVCDFCLTTVLGVTYVQLEFLLFISNVLGVAIIM